MRNTIHVPLGARAYDVRIGTGLIANAGADAVQEVPHFHMHILAGRPLGPMLMRGD